MTKDILNKIQIPVAYSLFKRMPICVGLDQFTQIRVSVKGIKDSNKFLHSFCNQLDIILHPDHTENVAPWIYRPSKHQVHGNVSFRVIGKVQTSIGHFTIGYLTDNSSNIDTLCLYSNNCKEEYEQVFKSLVKKSLEQMYNLTYYDFQAYMDFPMQDITVECYAGSNFSMTIVDTSVKVVFRIGALTANEAMVHAINRMVHFSAFISQETNMCWIYRDLSYSKTPFTVTKDRSYDFYRPYIDQFPAIGNKVCWSPCAYRFVDEFIFIESDSNEEDAYQYVISGARHVREALWQESRTGAFQRLVMDNSVLTLSPRDSRDKQAFMTLAMMSYMSALESATMLESKEKKCEVCGSIIYSIGNRVKDVVSKYFNNELGLIFKQLYNYRSKFLHAGKYPLRPTYPRNIPRIDPSTATGLEDTDIFSVKSNGSSVTVSIMNIREWTTYVLRCYYQDKLFGITDSDIDTKDNNATGIVPHPEIQISIEPLPGIEIEDMIIE